MKAFPVGIWWREAVVLVAGTLISWVAISVLSHIADVVVAVVATLQLTYYLFATFRQVLRHLQHDDHSLVHCLALLLLLTLFYIFAGGINFAMLSWADPEALENFHSTGFWFSLFDGWYFSTVTFTATGFGDIVPKTYPAKITVWGEMILGFATSVFAISAFISFANRSK